MDLKKWLNLPQQRQQPTAPTLTQLTKEHNLSAEEQQFYAALKQELDGLRAKVTDLQTQLAKANARLAAEGLPTVKTNQPAEQPEKQKGYEPDEYDEDDNPFLPNWIRKANKQADRNPFIRK
ncbi:hypothetical protein [Rhodoflexus caldus]|uniref:hypothetical protein n=1 Tax=Rhodoflexus caldus TaxID=2891236 RepID=UPI00202A7DF7|nr:hypothetical protein [Rhodoflexus caldus]